MSRPTSVLHARVVANAGGGPDKTILRSTAYLPPDRYTVAAAYLHPAGDPRITRLCDKAHANGLPMHTIPERGAIDRRAFRHLADVCRRLRINIWHSHDYKTDVLGLLVRRRCPGMKLVSTVHGFTRENPKTRFYARLNELAWLGYDHVFAVSPDLVRHCARHGVHPDRLTYLPNAIELERYPRRTPETRDAARSAYGVGDGGPHLCVVGRLSREKAVDRALRLFATLRGRHPGAALHLVGDGPERRRLTAFAQEVGVADAVTFHGWRDDPAGLLGAMDLLVLTSRTEGMPNAVLEAMALGVPVAATAVGGVPEMLGYGETGVLLPDGDEAAWAGLIGPLLRATPIREAMILTARRRVEMRYGFGQRMERVRGVYEALCPKSIRDFGLVA